MMSWLAPEHGVGCPYPHTKFPYLVGHRCVRHAPRQVDGELGAVEDVDGGRPLGQRLPRCRGPDDGALARLGHTVVAGVEHAESDLGEEGGKGVSVGRERGG